MRRLVLLLSASLLSTLVVFTTAPAALAGDTKCTGLVMGTIPGNLIVPRGQVCTLKNARVLGNVYVRPTGALNTQENVHVDGSIQADQPQWIGLGYPFGTPRNTVGGNVQIKKTISTPPVAIGAFNFICNTDVSGDVQIEESTVNAPWDIGYSHSCTAGTPTGPAAFGNIIRGDLQLYKNEQRVRIAQNDIVENLQFFDNKTTMSDHEICGAPGTGCDRSQTVAQTIGENLQVFKNKGGVHVQDNVVGEDTQCQDNDPPATGDDCYSGSSTSFTLSGADLDALILSIVATWNPWIPFEEELGL
jgi:hypothetical protein